MFSFVYSVDAVSRLSLGHILDLKTVSAWICHSELSEQGIRNQVLRYHRLKTETGLGNDHRREQYELEQWVCVESTMFMYDGL